MAATGRRAFWPTDPAAADLAQSAADAAIFLRKIKLRPGD
jgi:hypothetical protein